jgi:hypothetical protein
MTRRRSSRELVCIHMQEGAQGKLRKRERLNGIGNRLIKNGQLLSRAKKDRMAKEGRKGSWFWCCGVSCADCKGGRLVCQNRAWSYGGKKLTVEKNTGWPHKSRTVKLTTQ